MYNHVIYGFWHCAVHVNILWINSKNRSNFLVSVNSTASCGVTWELRNAYCDDDLAPSGATRFSLSPTSQSNAADVTPKPAALPLNKHIKSIDFRRLWRGSLGTCNNLACVYFKRYLLLGFARVHVSRSSTLGDRCWRRPRSRVWEEDRKISFSEAKLFRENVTCF